MLWRSFSVEPSHHPSLPYLPSRRVWLNSLLPVSQKSNSHRKGTTRWSSSLFGVHSVLIIWTSFMLHFYGNLLYLLVSFLFLIFNCVLWLFGSLCVFKKTQFVSVFRSTGASLKKEKRKSQSRAVTVKCCRSRCDLDLEHRNNNCTFSIFILAFSSPPCLFFWFSEWTLSRLHFK